MNTPEPKKSLGQHWMHDENVLNAIVEAAGVKRGDIVLEVGPGLGSLTMHLLERGAKVTAVEKDESLVETLSGQKYFKDKIEQGNLSLVNGDILTFDKRTLPENYKVIANIPYYLTSNLLRTFLEDERQPNSITVLIQKEVAERVVAGPGDMSILALSVQFYGDPKIIGYVDRELFEPPPEVDSAILHIDVYPEPIINVEPRKFFRLIKAGFAEKRKLLKNSLAGGLHMDKDEISKVIKTSNLDDKPRAQELSLKDWASLLEAFELNDEL